MKRTVHVHIQKAPFVTIQDVIHALVLIAIALVFCLVPTRGFGQPLPGNIGDAFAASSFDTLSPSPAMAAISEPATASFAPVTPDVPAQPAATANPDVEKFFAPQRQAIPEPTTATANPVTAQQFSPYQQTQLHQRLPQRREVATADTEHPFRQYWGVPNDPQTKITGKPMSVAELFAGTRSASARRSLLQAYWELSGLLAVYHFRCETERQATGTAGAQQENMLTLLREQRRTAEMEFIKQQWVLAELLKQSKGRTLRESDLPIPSDYPLYLRYETFADKIARSERTQYLGRMIPIQEQLIESKNGTWKAASAMTQSAAQPFFVVSSQRTTAFLDLTKAVVEYNKMIAEYALETIPPNVSQQQLVGAVVRLPSANPTTAQSQMATQGITLTQYEAPLGVAAQPVEQVGYEFQVPSQNETPDSQLDSAPDAVMEPTERDSEEVLSPISTVMSAF